MAMTKNQKIGFGIGAALTLGVVLWLILKPKNATAVKNPVKATPVVPTVPVPAPALSADMPALSVVHDVNATDDYSVTLGNSVFFYSKGDAPVTNKVDNTWSVYTATSQDNKNNVLVSVLKNGAIVFSQTYL